MSEMLFTLVPAVICFTDRRSFLAGICFVMCVGMSIQFTGVYMQSAQNPYGTSFGGALSGKYNDLTKETHDWSVVFGNLGITQYSYDLGLFTEEFGRAVSIIFFLTSVLCLLQIMFGRIPKKRIEAVSLGALISTVYFR